MTDMTSAIASGLDFEEVKSQKIFQKFLRTTSFNNQLPAGNPKDSGQPNQSQTRIQSQQQLRQQSITQLPPETIPTTKQPNKKSENLDTFGDTQVKTPAAQKDSHHQESSKFFQGDFDQRNKGNYQEITNSNIKSNDPTSQYQNFPNDLYRQQSTEQRLPPNERELKSTSQMIPFDPRNNNNSNPNDPPQQRILELESRCSEYQKQLNVIQSSFSNFQAHSYQESRQQCMRFEGIIQSLQGRLYETSRREEYLGMENEKLRQRLNHEQMLRTRTEEEVHELDILLRDTQESRQEAQRKLASKADEIQALKQQLDTAKERIQDLDCEQGQLMAQARNQRDTHYLEEQAAWRSEQSSYLERIEQISADNRRMNIEIDELKQKNSNLRRTNEEQTEDYYATKHNFIDKCESEARLIKSNERAQAEIVELKALLARYEGMQNGQFETRQTIGSDNSSNIRIKDQNKDYSIGFGSTVSTGSPHKNRIDMKQTFDGPMTKQGSSMNKQAGNHLNMGNNNNNPTSMSEIRKKNMMTPSNFLAWDQQATEPTPVPTPTSSQQSIQTVENRMGLPAGSSYFSSGGGQSRDTVERMYANVQSQMTRDQEYVSQQYSELLQQNSRKNAAPVTPPNKGNSFVVQNQPSGGENENNKRNTRTQSRSTVNLHQRQEVNAEYSQIYANQIAKEAPNQQNQRNTENKTFQVGESNQSRIIKNIETNLMMLNVERDNLKLELQRLEESKLKNVSNERRKQEVVEELALMESNISSQKSKLRDLNVLQPY